MSCGLLPRWSAGSRDLATFECLDDAHCAAATGAWFAQGQRSEFVPALRFLLWRKRPDQNAGLCDVGLALCTSQQPIVADAMEAIGQDMHEEPADELLRCEAHDLHSVAALDPVVLPTERHGVGIGTDETAVRDRYAVRVPTEIGQHRAQPNPPAWVLPRNWFSFGRSKNGAVAPRSLSTTPEAPSTSDTHLAT